MVRHRTEWLTVICAGLLLGGLHAQDRDYAVVLIPNPAEITSSPEAAEKLLNDQAGRGYRLVSIRDLQLWQPVGAARAPSYRVVSEPVVQFQTYAHVRDANARFVDHVDQLAREGFRIRREAIIGFGSYAWGTLRGGVVMERQPGSTTICRYGVVHPSDTRDDGVELPRGFEPLPLPLRGILTESCGSTDAAASGGPTLRRAKPSFRWYDSVEENDERSMERLAGRADEGCRLVGVWPTAGHVVLCDPGGSPVRARHRLIHLPKEETGMLREPHEPGDLSDVQAQLSTAAAQGYCLAGGALPSGAPLLLERETPAAFHCEYRLVVAEGQRLIDMVKRGLSHGFEPTWRASIPWGALLERLRPADDGPASDGSAR